MHKNLEMKKKLVNMEVYIFSRRCTN